MAVPGTGISVASPHQDGRWISDEVNRIVEIIADLDPMIEVQWVPPEKRHMKDPAFRFIENHMDGSAYIMFYEQDEESFKKNALARILAADQTKNPLCLATIDSHNDAIKLSDLRSKQDALDEKHDLAQHIMKSPKSRYRHNGKVYE